jgi:hypothetical protein
MTTQKRKRRTTPTGLSGRPLWVGSFALALATALSAAGSVHAVMLANTEHRLAHAGVRTHAVLLSADRIRLSAVREHAEACQVSYSFVGAGHTVRATARMPAEWCPRLRSGEPLVVSYLQSSPETHRVAGSEQRAFSLAWGLFGALGAATSGTLLASVWLSRWRSRSRDRRKDTVRCRA